MMVEEWMGSVEWVFVVFFGVETIGGYFSRIDWAEDAVGGRVRVRLVGLLFGGKERLRAGW